MLNEMQGWMTKAFVTKLISEVWLIYGVTEIEVDDLFASKQ